MLKETLIVLVVVLVAVVIRDTTEFSPASPTRLWATRIAVFTIIIWFITGLVLQVRATHSMWRLVGTRSFDNAIVAIVVVWWVFRDEF